MVLVVFRSRLRPEHADAFRARAAGLMELATAMPGFVSYKVFTSEDGERCSLIEWESEAHLRAWREHPEHRRAQQEGRDRFYESYALHVAVPARASRFERGA